MNGRFYKLSQDIAARKDLRASDKLVYAVIVDHIGQHETGWPSKRTIMRKTGLASKTVCDAIERLETTGALCVERRGRGRSNCYRISGSVSEPVQKRNWFRDETTGGSKSEPEVVQKVNPNQTDSNKTHSSNSSFVFVLKNGKTYTLPQAKLEEYRATFAELDIEAELRKAAQWLIDNPDRRKTTKGMPRFLSGWLGRCKPSEMDLSESQRLKLEKNLCQKFIDDNAPTAAEADAILRKAGI